MWTKKKIVVFKWNFQEGIKSLVLAKNNVFGTIFNIAVDNINAMDISKEKEDFSIEERILMDTSSLSKMRRGKSYAVQ